MVGTLHFLGFGALVLCPDGSYVRRTRDIKTATVYQQIGISIVNYGVEASYHAPDSQFRFQFDRYCQGSTGSPGPSPKQWSTPVAGLFEGPDTDLPGGWGGVTVPGGYAYQRRAILQQFAQFDVVVELGVPKVINFVMPAIEIWEFEYAGGGNIIPAETLTRTIRDFTTADFEHHFIFVGSGGPE